MNELSKLGYDGVVFYPEERDGTDFDKSLVDEQIEWEHRCLNAADVVVFWVPRELRDDFEMAAFTTNVEWGLLNRSGKVFGGGPADAPKNHYLEFTSPNGWSTSLDDVLKLAVDFVGPGAKRTDVEVLVPAFIFNSSQFGNWYKSQLAVGNYLTDFHVEYQFTMPKAGKLFLTIFKPDVFIAAEQRVKSNEFVIARTDMSYVLAYKPAASLEDVELVVVKEFRSPVRNDVGYVCELPGGSSLNPDEDPLTAAAHELSEEVGLDVDPGRFKVVAERQSAATLCSHTITLFTVQLTDDELEHVKADATNNVTHGVSEDTEVTFVSVVTVAELRVDPVFDWTTLGMALSGCELSNG